MRTLPSALLVFGLAATSLPGQSAPPAGMSLWLKADAGVQETGGEVLSWIDQSPSGHVFMPPGPSSRPTTTTINGLSAIHFDGSNQVNGGIGKNLTNATFVALVRYTVDSSDNDYLYAVGNEGSSGSQMCFSRRFGNNAYHFDGAVENVSPIADLPADQFLVLTQTFGEVGADSHMLREGGRFGMQSTAGNPYLVDASSFVIGNFSRGSFAFVGDLVELLVYDRVLTPNERVVAECYLQVRAGVQSTGPRYVDMSTWSIVQYEMNAQDDAQWQLENYAERLTQSVNADPSIFLGDFDITNLELTGTIRGGSAPDHMGFVFGYQDRGHYYLFNWKKVTADYLNFGTADAGLSVRVVDVQGGGDPTGTDLWGSAATANTTVLATDPTPWVADTVYDYRLAFRPGGFEIEILDGNTTIVDWSIQDSTYTGGRFGYYINSMQGIEYSRPEVEPIDVVGTTYGQACPFCGIAPEMIATGSDAAGGSLNLRLLSGMGGAPGFIGIGFGRAAIPFGAGCFLNIDPTIAFVIGPMATSGSVPGSGTAGFNVTIPAFIPAGTVITFQNAFLDPRPFFDFSMSSGVEVVTK